MVEVERKIEKRNVEEISGCKYKQRIMLVLQSGNREEVRYIGGTEDEITGEILKEVIVQPNRSPYWLSIRYEEIKWFYEIKK